MSGWSDNRPSQEIEKAYEDGRQAGIKDAAAYVKNMGAEYAKHSGKPDSSVVIMFDLIALRIELWNNGIVVSESANGNASELV